MRTFVVALTIAALALPACAQAGPGGRKHRGSEQTERKPKVDDKAYSRALSSLPDQKYDPWKAMR
jgi:hypothetical protein